MSKNNQSFPTNRLLLLLPITTSPYVNHPISLISVLHTGVKFFFVFFLYSKIVIRQVKATSLRVMTMSRQRQHLRSLQQKFFSATLQWLDHPSLKSPPVREVPTSSLPKYCQRLPGSSFQCISQHQLSYPPLYSARKAPEGLHSSAGISAESYNKSFAFCVSAFCLFC